MRLVVLALALLGALPAAAQSRPPTIAAVRQLSPTPPGGPDVVVTVLGVVTRAFGRQIFLQDSTAAINVFSPQGELFDAVRSGSVRAGDSLQVTGRLVEFQPTTGQPGTGWLEIFNVQSDGFFVSWRDVPLPAAQRVTLAEIVAVDPDADTYESQIVRVDSLTIDAAGATTFAASTSYTVRQTVGGVETTGVMRVAGPGNATGDSELVGRPIPTGPFDFIGPVNQFRGTNQLLPVRATDVTAAGTTAGETTPEAPGLAVVSVFPNPAGAGGATVRFDTRLAAPVRVAVLDALGRTVATADGPAGAGEQTVWLDTSAFPVGVYLVRIVSAGVVATARLVVARQ